MRWEHPERGVLPPAEFLPAAQRTGMIVELGQFVLHTACEQAAVWRRKRPWLKVAVNVSERELFDPDFAAQVAGVLATTGLPPEALVLEVTETVLAAEEQITEILHPLTAMGVQVRARRLRDRPLLPQPAAQPHRRPGQDRQVVRRGDLAGRHAGRSAPRLDHRPGPQHRAQGRRGRGRDEDAGETSCATTAATSSRATTSASPCQRRRSGRVLLSRAATDRPGEP